MLRPALVSMRWLLVISITSLGLIAGAILGYTATFFAYLWLHPPSPARLEFQSANTFSLAGAALGAIGGLIGGMLLGWRVTRRRLNDPNPEE